MKKVNWFEETFSTKRVLTSITFSAIIGITYWATTIYEKAFDNVWLTISAFLLVALVLLLFGGSLLDTMSKN